MPSHPPNHSSRHRLKTSRSRSRSRSPYRSSRHHRSPLQPRSRSRSPHRHDGRDSTRHKRKRSPQRPASLPFRGRPLSKHDYAAYKPMFALYLDIQKQLVLEDLDEHEARGRWKSFIGKWNRGELAEGWYDPATLQKSLDKPASDSRSPKNQRRDLPSRNAKQSAPPVDSKAEEESSDNEIGPALPSQDARISRAGPAIPRMEDLELRDELCDEDRAHHIDDLRYARKLDRNAQKERLEELVPRADPGSRERQLEKRREATATLHAFRKAKSPGAEEVGEADLLGDDGIDGFKKRKKEAERKKNEREIRKEEILRVRAEEREERLQEVRAKEEKTMEMLKAIAKQRFG